MKALFKSKVFLIINVFCLTIFTACGGNNSPKNELKYGDLSILVPAAVADESPLSPEIEITIIGQNFYRVQNATSGTVTFAALPYGAYTLKSVVRSGGVLASEASTSITVNSATQNESLPVKFNRAALNIAPVTKSDYSAYGGIYYGSVNYDKCGLILPTMSSAARFELTLGKGKFNLEAKGINGGDTTFTGTIDDSTGALTASGTFLMQDGKGGTFTIEKIIVPQNGAIFFNIKMVSGCDETMVFAAQRGIY